MTTASAINYTTNCYGYYPAPQLSQTLSKEQIEALIKIAEKQGHKVKAHLKLFGNALKKLDWKLTVKHLEAALMKDPALRAAAEQLLGGTLQLGKDTWDGNGVRTTDPTKADSIIRFVPGTSNSYPALPGYPQAPGNPPITYPSYPPISYAPTPYPVNNNGGNSFDQIANDFFTRVLPPMDARIAELERQAIDPNLKPEQQQAAQMELQKLSQRRAELISMFSNILKSIHDTNMAIIQNMRV